MLARPYLNTITIVLSVSLAASTLASGAGASRKDSTLRKISFYGDLGNPVNSPYMKNPRLVRPSGLVLFEDGSWAIGHLRWAGWGTRVARARGISSASDCIPSCANGTLTNVPARLTLSRPGRVLGHLVYRCFRLTLPSYPKSDVHGCLRRTGKFIDYSATPMTKPPPAKKAESEFYWPGGGVVCAMGPGLIAPGKPGVPERVLCMGPADVATLLPTGQINICQGGYSNPQCLTGNAGQNTPTLAYGEQMTVGPFRCSSAQAGITCVVLKTGQGFLINRSGATAVP